MLAELVGWYAGQDQNRRRYPRVRKNFDARYSINSGRSWLQIRGVDLGGGGMCAYSDHPIGTGIVDVVLVLNNRDIPLKAQPAWSTEVNENGKPQHCYGLQFTSVQADQWDLIMQWVTGKPYQDTGPMPSVRIDEREIARFLPEDLRKRMLAELVALGRYDAMPSEPAQFDYGGVGTIDGRPMHRFAVHTKVRTLGSSMRYTTRLLVDDEGKEISVLN